MRVVLDTSTLVAAFRSGSGAAAEVVRLAALVKIAILLDFKLVCEYREVLLRPEHLEASGRSPEDAEAIIEMLEAVATPVLVRFKHRPLSRDANDDMVLDVAINGHAVVIVTANTRDFSAGSQFGIPAMTPRQFLIAWREGGFHDAD